jgi:hypothetical protein
MKVILKFPKQWLYLFAMAFLFTIIPLSQFTSLKFIPSLGAGCILSLMNAFLGHVVIEQGFRLNDRQFLIVSLGGLVIRFFSMIIAVALVLIVARVNVLVFILSLMSFYIVFMTLEVIRINKKIDSLKPAGVYARG